jgi:hypothetical protein
MVKLRRSLVVWTMVLLVGFCYGELAVSASSPVEDMTGRLPDDVIAFTATSGCEYVGPAFEKSIVGRIWNDPETKSFYQSIKSGITAKMTQHGDPNAAEVVNEVLEIVQLALARPVVIGTAKNNSQNRVGAYGFLILDVGAKKDKITAAVSKLEARAPEGEIVDVKIGSYNMHGPKEPEDVPVYWGWVGNYFVFAINDGEGLTVKYLQNPRSGSTYLSDVSGAGDAIAMFIDFPKIMDLVKQLVEQEAEAAMAGRFITIIGELGLNSVKNIKVRAGFDGADVVGDELVEVEGARSGLLACMRAMDISLFDAVDARAVSAGASNVDVALISEAYMKMIKAVMPDDVSSKIDEAISGFETDANVNLCTDLVKNLAGPMVGYAMPMGVVMEAPAGGIALVAELNDGAAFEKAMTAIGQYASAKSKGMLQVSAQAKGDGTVVHTWGVAPLMMAQIMPTWAVVNGKLILASNTNLYTLAEKQVTSTEPKKTSLSGTEVFKKVSAGVPENLVSFSYTDSQSQFKQLLMTLQQFWPMMTMMATQQGVKLPMMLPTYSDIIKDMGPTVSYSWWDSKGLRSRYKGSGIEASAGIVGGAVGFSIMMPALAQARNKAQRIVSATNISGLVRASLVYANDDEQGRFPPNLEKLIELDYISSKQLESRLKPKDFSGPSYIYIAGQTADTDPGNMLVYENPAYCRDGVNAGFVDAHVKWMRRDEFLQALEATYKRLGREMPEIKFKD